MTPDAEPSTPAWETAFFSLLHPAQIAIVEARLWIGRPLSAHALNRVLSPEWLPGTSSYHVRTLAATGVLEKLYTTPTRGGVEHHYGPARR
jgi:hypothetical protein